MAQNLRIAPYVRKTKTGASPFASVSANTTTNMGVFMKYCRIVAILAIVAALGFSGCFAADQSRNSIQRGSFAAGTNVWTQSGLIPIQEVTAGSVVYALDLTAGEWSYQPVLEVLKHTHSGDLITVQAGNERLLVTPDHPFLVAGIPAS